MILRVDDLLQSSLTEGTKLAHEDVL